MNFISREEQKTKQHNPGSGFIFIFELIKKHTHTHNKI
jgi:hypothetical protein